MKKRGPGRQPGSKDKPHEARPFSVRFTAGGWQVKAGQNWVKAREVSLLAPVIGNGAGELRGLGVVSRHGNTLRITG